MKIFITNKQQDLSINKTAIQTMVSALAHCFEVTFDEVSFHFVTEKKIKELHLQFFQDPTPTDCITLPIDPPSQKPYCLLGEVFICPKVALDYAKNHHLPADQELFLYVIHGFLHLIGYDDMEEEEEKKMRAMEKHAFEYLNQRKLC